MQYRPLGNTGLNVSALGFGASSLGGVFRATDDGEAIKTVRTALDLGVNFFDVSPYYGDTRAEIVLGQALRGVDRQSYHLATKVGQYGEGEFDFSARRVSHSLDESFLRLGTDYIDLLQCHDIEYADLNQIVDETLPALLRLKQAGRIGHIGITGLPLHVLRAVLDRTPPGLVETVLSFCHYTLNDTSLETLFPYLSGKGVGLINAAPTGMGLLTPRGAPDWHPAPLSVVVGCRRAVEYCESVGADIVQLAIQFAVSQPAIATTLISTASPENMRRNIAAVETAPDPALLARVLDILRPVHNHPYSRGLPENQNPPAG